MPSSTITTALPALPALLIALLALAPSGARAASVAAGRAKAPMCAACHGLDGRSQMPEAPNLAGQVEGYLVAQLQAFKAGTRHNEQMAIIAGALSPQDMQDLAAYYASLDASVAANAHP
jgi:cytochrome c553